MFSWFVKLSALVRTSTFSFSSLDCLCILGSVLDQSLFTPLLFIQDIYIYTRNYEIRYCNFSFLFFAEHTLKRFECSHYERAIYKSYQIFPFQYYISI